MGGEPRYEGVARDTRASLEAILLRARRGADLLIATGGASTGERDLVKSVLTQLGAEFRFAHVAMRPGRPFGFAKRGPNTREQKRYIRTILAEAECNLFRLASAMR